MTRSERTGVYGIYPLSPFERHASYHANVRKMIGSKVLTPGSLRLQFGRCSVRTYYASALEILRANQELFSTFIEHKVSMDQAEEVSWTLHTRRIALTELQYYTLFEQNKIAKTIFVP